MRQKSTVLYKYTDPRLMGSGRVDSGVSIGTGEFLDGALGPSGAGLGKRQAGLIFSQCSKYCSPHFCTGNPVMETGPSQKSCALVGGGGDGSMAASHFLFSIGKAGVIGASGIGVFPFKDTGAAEISLYAVSPFHFLFRKKGMTIGPASQGWGVWHRGRAQYIGAVTKMMLRAFKLKLQSSSDVGTLGDGRADEES